MMDSYVYVITALLPLTALMVVLQKNPYHALIVRGVLGAIAALTYTVLGSADVALTEALVGTLLAITLYAVAVRSSMIFRLGVLKDDLVLDQIRSLQPLEGNPDISQHRTFNQVVESLKTIFQKRYMQVEQVPFLNREDLQQALLDKDVHAICAQPELPAEPGSATPYIFDVTIRIRHLYDILRVELAPSLIQVSYIKPTDSNFPVASPSERSTSAKELP